MATLTTEWQTIKSYEWNQTARVTFCLDAKYTTQSITNNTTTIQTRLRSVLNSGSISGSGYNFSCSYAPTVSGDGVWTFETETITSGEGTVTHNDDGTKSLTLSANIINYYWGLNQTLSDTVTLPSIPRKANLLTAQDFNDTGNPTITYQNSAGNSVTSLQACIANQSGSTIYVAYRDVSKTGSSYTFNLTSSERTTLRNATATTSKNLPVGFFLKTVIGGNTYYSQINKTMTIVNGEPTLSYTIKETDEDVIETLGTDTILIKGVSKPKVTITATPKYNATISSYYTKLNNLIAYSREYTFSELTGNALTIRATDSRDFSKTENYTLSIIDYFKPNATVEVSRATDGNDNAYANINGTWYNDGFGEVDNELTITWEYRETTDTEWTQGGTITPTISGNAFTVTNELLGNMFTYTKEYYVKFTISDLFTERQYTATRKPNKYTLKQTYFESDIVNYVDFNGVEDYIYETYELMNLQTGTSLSYTRQNWLRTSMLLATWLNNIENAIQNLANNYFKPMGWSEKKTWSTTKPETFSYGDINRWITNLNLLTERLYQESNLLLPSDDLYPSDTLLPH